jgi:hypothetical protein
MQLNNDQNEEMFELGCSLSDSVASFNWLLTGKTLDSNITGAEIKHLETTYQQIVEKVERIKLKLSEIKNEQSTRADGAS